MPYIKCVNIEQENAMEELKNRAKNELNSLKFLKDDALFYKYLKAQNFNVDKAEKTLRKHIVWRKVYQVDDILENFKPKEVFLKYIEPSVIGFDKEADIVLHIPSGRINSVELFKCIKMNHYVRHMIWCLEKHKRLANETGRKTSVSLILNLDKLEFANAVSKVSADVLLHLTEILRDNYAERLKAIYIINAPFYNLIIFKMIKVVMPKAMMKKFHVFGQNGWKEKLLEVIDASVLLAFLGGKRTDPDGDPYCKSFIKLPGKIPESYNLSEEERYFEDKSDVITLEIFPSEKKEVLINVKQVGSLIRWKFMVQSKTILFGLFIQDLNSVKMEVLPLYEYDTSDGSEENSHECNLVGKYVLVFDNSHSKFSSKEVQYAITVEKTDVLHNFTK